METQDLKQFQPVFEAPEIAPEDRYLAEPFFTNLDRPAYGVSMLPPEVIGALCSRTSRAKDDLRAVLLKEYIRPFLGDGTEYSRSLRAFIDFLHQHPMERVFANPKAREFYIKWLAQFGDDSIAQMSGTHLVYPGISQLAIKHIEDMRLGIAPIEKSTRYVDYSSKVAGSYRYYADPTFEQLGLMGEYRAVMDHLFNTYASLLERYKEYLRGQFPGAEDRLINTKAFDTVRLILPVSTLSQLALFANGQGFEYMINRGLDHPLGEIRWASQAALDELSKIIPAFLHRLQSPASSEYRRYLSERSSRVRNALLAIGFSGSGNDATANSSAVKLLEWDAQGEDKVIAGIIYQESHEPWEVILGKVRELSGDQKKRILDSVLYDRKFKYYKIPRGFEQAMLRWEVQMNIGAWRDLHRHRIQTQVRQRFTVAHGFDVPEGLREAGLDGIYMAAVHRAEELFRKVERLNPDLAQYCCCMGHRVRFEMFHNLRAFWWISELRTIAQGHPDYRKPVQEMARQVQCIYPLLAPYLLVDMNDYEFARRGDSAAILKKEEQLKAHLGS